MLVLDTKGRYFKNVQNVLSKECAKNVNYEKKSFKKVKKMIKK